MKNEPLLYLTIGHHQQARAILRALIEITSPTCIIQFKLSDRNDSSSNQNMKRTTIYEDDKPWQCQVVAA
jgi:hypothetical protein